jgi:hypothetical protein
MASLTYANETVELSDATINALVARGMSHVMTNEVSSRLVSYMRGKIIDGSDRKASDVSKDEIQAYRKDFGEAVSAALEVFRGQAWEAIKNGTLGVSRSGGGGGRRVVDPVERIMRAILVAEIKLVLGSQGVKFKKMDDTITLGSTETTPNAFTQRWLDGVDRKGIIGKAGEANEPRIRREAERQVALLKTKETNAAKVEGGDVKSQDDLT